MIRGARYLVIALVVFAPVMGVAQAQALPGIGDYFNSISAAQDLTGGTAASVDLLFESNSYVPPFYRGRSLPSPGSLMSFRAVAHFATAGGSSVPESQIVYTWRRNGQVEGLVSGTGRSSVTLAAPTLYGVDTISVEARTADGSIHGSAAVSIPAVDPGVTLYADHPLYGIEYYDAIPAQASIYDVEMSFAAVPYFVPFLSPNDTHLSYIWSVNGIPVAATSTNGNEITINAQNSNGLAALAVFLSSPIDALLSARNGWSVLFSRNTFGGSRTNAQ